MIARPITALAVRTELPLTLRSAGLSAGSCRRPASRKPAQSRLQVQISPRASFLPDNSVGARSADRHRVGPLQRDDPSGEVARRTATRSLSSVRATDTSVLPRNHAVADPCVAQPAVPATCRSVALVHWFRRAVNIVADGNRTHAIAKPCRLRCPREHNPGLAPRDATHLPIANSADVASGLRNGGPTAGAAALRGLPLAGRRLGGGAPALRDTGRHGPPLTQSLRLSPDAN